MGFSGLFGPKRVVGVDLFSGEAVERAAAKRAHFHASDQVKNIKAYGGGGGLVLAVLPFERTIFGEISPSIKELARIKEIVHEGAFERDMSGGEMAIFGHDFSDYQKTPIFNNNTLLTQKLIKMGVSEDEIKKELILTARSSFALPAYKHHEMAFIMSNDGIYSAFILDEADLSWLDGARQFYRYIDALVPSPLVFGALYKSGYLAPAKKDAFIYISAESAFVAIYDNGAFWRCKQLFGCDLGSAKSLVQYRGDDFSKEARSNGELMRPFNEAVAGALKEALSQMGLSAVGRVFECGSVAGLSSVLDERLNGAFDGLCRRLEIVQKWGLAGVVALNNEGQIAGGFNIYKRPPSFYKMPLGQLLMAAGAAFIVGAGGGVVSHLERQNLQNELNEQLRINAELEGQIVAFKGGIGGLQNSLNELKTANSDAAKKLQSAQDDLSAATTSFKNAKSVMIASIASHLNTLNIEAKEILIEGSEAQIELVLKDQKTLTALLNSLQSQFNISSQKSTKTPTGVQSVIRLGAR